MKTKATVRLTPAGAPDRKPDRMRITFTVFAVLSILVACEKDRPMARTGEALDRAGSRTGAALGTAAEDTGAALNRAGSWVGRKLSP